MGDDISGVWPADVPAQLWNYDLLRPATDRPFPLPLMGMKPDWVFVGYYLAGMAIILIFAWKRFNKRAFGTSPDDYLVLQELSPTELRGTGKIAQAYIYYAGILLLIYSALAFFGNVIVAVLKSTDIAGLQVDIDPTSFGSRSWPITLALAFAGFTELLRPIDVAEVWLRRQTHHWVGLPSRVMARTERLLRLLDSRITADESVRSDWARNAPQWARVHIEHASSFARLAQKYAQLKAMAALVHEPGSWPDLSLLNAVKPIAKRVSVEADAAMAELDEVLNHRAAWLKAPTSPASPPSSSPSVVATPSIESPAGISMSASAGNVDLVSEEAEAARQQQKEMARLDAAVEALNKSRKDTGALLAVYAERDARKSGLGNSPVERAISDAFPWEPRTDAGFWILVLLVPIFFLYAAMTMFQMHALLGNVKLGGVTVFATALAETLRLAAIFLLPLLAVLAFRDYLRETDRWHPFTIKGFGRDVAIQTIAVLAVAFAAALISLIGVCLAWMAAIAENEDRFRTILFSARQAAIPFFISYVPCAVMFTWITVWAIDSLLVERTRAKTLAFGMLNALLVILLMAIHLVLWNGAGCTEFSCVFERWDERFQSVSTLSDLYSVFNLTDFVAYLAIAVLSATLFALPGMGVRPASRSARTRTRTPMLQGAVLLIAAGLFLLPAAFPAIAEVECGPTLNSGCAAPKELVALPTEKDVIYVGVRADAEPFSYKAGKGSDTEGLAYRGFAVDLCYQLFESSKYRVALVEVTAQDRFKRLRKRPRSAPSHTDSASPPIDILCEPTTLRFNHAVEKADGVFSPVIFATGVASIMRTSRSANATDTYLAYVQGTTAARVADLACKNDMFALHDVDRFKPVDCNEIVKPSTKRPASGATQVSNCDPVAAAEQKKLKNADRSRVPDAARYYVCAFESHDELIAWFCQDTDTDFNARIVYFGDQEIIRSKLASAQAKEICPKNGIEPLTTAYTYEPYALLISKADPDLVQFVQRRVYDFFSHRSRANGLFASYFPGSKMSPILAYLFLLNAVDDEEFFQVPYLERARNQTRALATVPSEP